MIDPIPLLPYWEKNLASGLVKPLRALDWSTIKTSDTCFILGAGPSINDFGPEVWEHVNQHNSFAFNSFCFHDFIPSLYQCEARTFDALPHYYNRWKALEVQYSGIPFLIKDGNSQESDLQLFPEKLRENLYLSREVLIQGYDVSSYRQSLWGMFEKGAFTQELFFDLIPKRRSSGIYMLCLAIKVGFKNIVLMGFDMNNQDYFCDNPNEKKNEIYCAEDPRHGPPVSMVFQAIKEEITDRMGISIFVGSDKSKLRTMFPNYFDRRIL